MRQNIKRTLSISIVASMLLSNQALLAASLPSGGKFVNDKGGSFGSCGSKCLNISGNDKHNVIAWGGGFNIGEGHTVNFKGDRLGYLNLDFSGKASQLLGTLNGGTNNIFLVNPSGVLVGANGVINANKFVASTNPMNDTQVKEFAANGKFSSSISSKGDIVNLGNINANEVILAGNKVENLSGKINGTKGQNGLPNKAYSDSIIIKGNNVYLDGDKLTGKSIDVEVAKGGSFTQHTTDYRNKHNITGGFSYNFSGAGLNNFQRFGYISNANDWKNFADNWNEGIGQFRDIFNEFRLTNDINMGGMVVDPVGNVWGSHFNKNFNGMGYTLSNIKINAGFQYAGLFGIMGDSLTIPEMQVGNIIIDGLNFEYNDSKLPKYIGGFIGFVQRAESAFSNITLKNIGEIRGDTAENAATGGFIGLSNSRSTFSYITIDGVASITGNYAGGFIGSALGDTFSNIAVNNVKNIEGNYAGGFMGSGSFSGKKTKFENIYLYFDKINMKGQNLGAFAGKFSQGETVSIDNITLVYNHPIIAQGSNLYVFAGNGIDNTGLSQEIINRLILYSNSSQNIVNDNNMNSIPNDLSTLVKDGIVYQDGKFSADLTKNPYPSESLKEPTKKGELENNPTLSSKDFATGIVEDIFKEIVDSNYKIELKDKNKVIVSYQGETYTIDLRDKNNPIAQAISFILTLNENNKMLLNADITAFVKSYPTAKAKFEAALAKIDSDKFNALVDAINEIILNNDELNRLVSKFESLKAQYDYKIYTYNQAVKEYNDAVKRGLPAELIASLKVKYELAYQDIVNTEGSLKTLQGQINNKFASLSQDFDNMVGDKEAFKQALGNLKLNEKYEFGTFGSYASQGGLVFSDYMPIASVDVPGNITYPERPALETGDNIENGNEPGIPTIPEIPGKPTDPNNPEVPSIPTVPPIDGGGGEPIDPNPILPDRPELEKPCPSGDCSGGTNPETRPQLPQPDIDYNVDFKLDNSKYQGELEQGEEIIAEGEYRNNEYTDGKKKKIVCTVSSSARTHNPCLIN